MCVSTTTTTELARRGTEAAAPPPDVHVENDGRDEEVIAIQRDKLFGKQQKRRKSVLRQLN